VHADGSVVGDAAFNGTNLLNSAAATNQMTVYFNTDDSSYLTIQGVDLTSATLVGDAVTAAITASGSGATLTQSPSTPPVQNATGSWANTDDINQDQTALLSVLNKLTADASQFGGNATLIQTRQDFTTNMITSLTNASSDLVSADTNTEGANLQALQAQDSLGIVALGVSGTLESAILKIL
jgi:flagellin-like hook-associated protein FlgL